MSVRGTLSLQDIITDLNADGEPLPVDPPRAGWMGHKGMVKAAEYIKSKLVDDGLLNYAFSYSSVCTLYVSSHQCPPFLAFS